MTAFNDNDIAIIGMASHVPGANDPDTFWQNVVAGTDSLVDLSEGQLRDAGVDRATLRDPNYVRRTGVLETVDQFDPAFFGIGERDAAIMDPQHRHLLECVWEALESAAIDPAAFDGAIGVFAGCGANTYLLNNLLTDEKILDSMGWFLLRHTSNDKDFLPTFISYKLDLQGPSISVQTACSTSLVALHLASQSLIDFECDMAIAGGSTIEVPHGVGYHFHEGEILSPDGHCRAFDEHSAGTVLTSGSGALVLRRAADALEDGDPILAVMRGSAVNNDGARKVGFLAPSVDGHADVVREALAVAGLSARDITLVDAHGTGTALGDPIEFAALTEAYRESTDESAFCRLTSTKPNIGHLDTAAGVASVIKVVQALRAKTLPPMANHSAPSPLLPLDGSPFVFSGEAAPWEPARPRRAAVSSLGVGGTNAHAIFEEAPERPAPAPSAAEQILCLSGMTSDAVDANARRLADHLEAHPEVELADVAHTLLAGRRTFPHRRVVVAADRAQAIELLRDPDRRRSSTGSADGDTPRVAFMFPGGGAQYAGMARGLDERFDRFHTVMREGATIVRDLGGPDLEGLLAAGGDEALQDADASLPAVFLTSLALARQWMDWGVEPDLLLGHSLGEYVAAHLADVFSLEDALTLVVGRSRLMASVGGDHTGMMVVPMAEAHLLDRLPDGLSLAVVNAEEECVVAGTTDLLDELDRVLASEEIETNRLRLSAAAHSSVLEPILDEFRELAAGISFSAPTRRYLSNRSGTWITEAEAMSPDYWTSHLRGTVRFNDNLRTALADGPLITVELGPGQALSSYARRQSPAPVLTVPALRHPDDTTPDTAHTLHAFAKPWLAGADVDLVARAGDDRRRITLPPYAFQRSRYWVEPGTRTLAAASTDATGPERIDDVDSWFWTPTWVESSAPTVTAPSGRWTVVGSGSLADRITAELGARGADAVTVADVPSELDDVAGVVFVGSEGAEAVDLDASMARHVHDALRVIRSLASNGVADTRFAVVTRGATDAGGQAARPVDALALGPVLVAPKEYPGLATALVDLAVDDVDDAVDIRDVVDDLLGEQVVVAHTDAGRFVPDYRSTDLIDAEPAEPIVAEGGTYVITGGLGDVGFALAQYLVERFAIKVAVVASSPVPEGDERNAYVSTHGSADPTVRRIVRCEALAEAAPASVVVAADLGDPDAVAAALESVERQLGPIDGAFHLAGNVNDALIELAEPDDIDRVVVPKATGAALVFDGLRSRGASSLFLMSSSSTLIAAEGQAAYVAANSYLDSLAGTRDGIRIQTVNSGTWAGTGRAADLAARIRLGLGKGTDFVHPVLVERLDQGKDTIVLAGQLDADHDWVVDEHRTANGQAVLPGTGHLALMLAGAEAAGLAPARLDDVMLAEGLVVESGNPVRVRVVIEAADADGSRGISVESDRGGGREWSLHSQAVARVGSPADAIEWPTPDTPDAVATDFLAQQRATLQFGPRWSCGTEARVGERMAIAELNAPYSPAEADAWVAHPAMVDVATAVGIALRPADPSMVLVPIGYDCVTQWAPVSTSVRVEAVRRSAPTDDDLVVDLLVRNDDGAVALLLAGVRIRPLPVDRDFGSIDLAPVSEPDDGAAFLDLAERLGMMIDDLPALFDRIIASPADRLIASSVDIQDLRRLGEPQVDAGDADPAALAAASGLEGALAGLWGELLGLDSVGEDDDFFDLGGHSLIAIRLMTRIQKQFGVRFQLAELFDAPTVAALATELRAIRPDVDDMFAGVEDAVTVASAPVAASDGSEVTAEAPVFAREFRSFVHLNRDGSGTPFTLVHGAGGNLLYLSQLARLMKGDRPLVGFQAAGIDPSAEVDPTLDAMADRYVKELLEEQPDGPYLLGGYSGGALVSLEMARRLQEQGKEILGVISLDGTSYSVTYPTNKQARRHLITNMVRQGPGAVMPYVKDRLLRRLTRWLSDVPPAQVSMAEQFQEDSSAAGFTDLWDHVTAVSEAHEKRKYDVDLTLVKADLVWPYHPHDYFWSKYVTGKIDVISGPGDHMGLMSAPNVEITWSRLKPVLDAYDS